MGAIALLALAVGCTITQTQSKENPLVAAGFKVITPHTAAQQQKLQALPAGKVTLVQKEGKTYYVFPDAANNQAYGARTTPESGNERCYRVRVIYALGPLQLT